MPELNWRPEVDRQFFPPQSPECYLADMADRERLELDLRGTDAS